MVSALIDSKRVLEGISAVAGMENAVLVVAGDGPLRQHVLEAAESMLPGRFRLISLAADDMPALYRSADVFLHLSLQESFGNVFLEAWASGLPIVAHDSDRLRWILGDGQYLCESTSPPELQAALQAALARGTTSTREGVERFSWRCVGSQYQDFIQATVRRQANSTACGNM
jgi:glycosyltransferase involved in cell wall biosynthesis